LRAADAPGGLSLGIGLPHAVAPIARYITTIIISVT
jgi:hypothetical protein